MAGGIKVSEFWSFLDALTASEDFEKFLKVMLEPQNGYPKGVGDLGAISTRCLEVLAAQNSALSGRLNFRKCTPHTSELEITVRNRCKAYRDDPDFELFHRHVLPVAERRERSQVRSHVGGCRAPIHHAGLL